MQNCTNCGHQNRPGVVYCENCGASLLGEKPLSTKSIDSSSDEEKAQMGIDSSVLTNVKVQGVSAFSIDDTLRLEIEGSPEPIIFNPKAETIFGRRDPATGAMPDVDLTPFAGYRMGVSRRHAAIRQGEEQSLNIWDLGSSNGSYLNGQELKAHRPYRLHDGDELRLGQMMIRIRFQVGNETYAVKSEHSSAPTSDAGVAEAKTADDAPGEKIPITTDMNESALRAVQKPASADVSETDKAADVNEAEKTVPEESAASPAELKTTQFSESVIDAATAQPPTSAEAAPQQSDPEQPPKQDDPPATGEA